MFNEPEEEPAESPSDPSQRAEEKAAEMRMHAELAAVFEGPRKFEAQIIAGFEPELARDVQRQIGKLEKAKSPDSPILPVMSWPDADALLDFPVVHEISTNDYHVYRRPGEVMIVRWLQANEVDTFYERMQAHADAALNNYREEQRAQEWKQDEKTQAFLAELEKIEMQMAERYLRGPIREHGLSLLTTTTADEMNIVFLCEHMMGASVAEVVGQASVPSEERNEQDLAWFFKLFALRGATNGIERMCFFTYLQKSDDSYDFEA